MAHSLGKLIDAHQVAQANPQAHASGTDALRDTLASVNVDNGQAARPPAGVNHQVARHNWPLFYFLFHDLFLASFLFGSR
jgi:hypothetical protein